MSRIQHVDDPKLVGRRIAELRAARGLSQRELATAGCSYAYISRIEAGYRTPSGQALEHLAELLGVSPRYLATGEPGSVELGLQDAGLELHELTEHERQVLDGAIEHATRHAAKMVGDSIVEIRAAAAAEVEAKLAAVSDNTTTEEVTDARPA